MRDVRNRLDLMQQIQRRNEDRIEVWRRERCVEY